MVRVELSSVDHAFALEGFGMTNPILSNEDKLMLPLRHLVQSCSKYDGSTTSSLVVPVEIVNHIVQAYDGGMSKLQTAQLVAMSFYLLLRVG